MCLVRQVASQVSSEGGHEERDRVLAHVSGRGVWPSDEPPAQTAAEFKSGLKALDAFDSLGTRSNQ